MTHQRGNRNGGRGVRMGLSAALGVAVVAGLALAAQEKAQPPSEDDQAGAVGCIRTLNTAEAYYAKTYNGSYSPSLAELSPPRAGEKESASAANLVDTSLTGGKKYNYVFTYKAGKKDEGGHFSSYTVTARPAKWAKGVRSFFTDQTAVIRWTMANRAPTAKDPPIQ